MFNIEAFPELFLASNAGPDLDFSALHFTFISTLQLP
jgi:hypothetical protein